MTQIRRIKSKKVHPKYVGLSYYDVAIFELETPVKFTSHVKPICLPKEATFDIDKYRDQQVILTGYGSVHRESNTIDGELKQIPIKIFSQRCVKNLLYNFRLTKYSI